MKHEWRKAEKALYGVKAKPSLLSVSAQQFITIKGQGNPNEEAFSERVSALYSLAYGIKMAYKKAVKELGNNQEMTDFTVYPLEGLWWQEMNTGQEELEKDKLFYTIMIRQPEVITRELFCQALKKVKIKKPNPLYDAISFEEIEDGQCVQMLHIGSYDDEPRSFAEMDAFIQEEGLKRSSKIHREIYLSNLQKTAKEKLKTILRYQVEEA